MNAEARAIDIITADEIAWQVEQHDNWSMADELRDLIPLVNRGTLAEQRRRGARHLELQQALATRFGLSRGWRRSRTSFSLQCLARGGHHDGHGYWSGYPRPAFDHLYFFRLDRRAVGIAVHLYGWPHVAGECRAIAAKAGLDVREVTDFPSWWYPGSTTTLVLYTGAIERAAEAERLKALADIEAARDD